MASGRGLLTPTGAGAAPSRFRGPWSYLWWLVRAQRGRVALGAVLGTVWTVGLAVPPYLLARATDALVEADRGAVLGWAVALVVSGGVLAWLSIWRHRTMTQVRMDGAFRTVELLARHSIRLGARQRGAGTGEVVTIGSGDAWTLGRSLTVTGPGVGAVIAYVVIAVLLLRISTTLALVVLAGVPLLAIVLGPALRPLHAVADRYRTQQGVLVTRIVDVIAGLGVLNGLGGKATHAARFGAESQDLQRLGYRVGAVTSVIQAAAAGLPSLFVAAVVWLAARLAIEGAITVGDVVAVFGYATVLAVPISFFIEGTVDLSRAVVAGRRVTDFLAQERGDDAATTVVPDAEQVAEGTLVDGVTGVVIDPGTFTVVVGPRHSDAAAVIDRLGGLRPGASLDGVPLAEVDPAGLRRRLLVADQEAAIFPGTLGEVIAGAAGADEASLREALRVAAADELATHADGLGTPVATGGATLSGGQRQRLRLARAVLADAPVMLAVDPTSAVDAATEATVVSRLRQARQGRTTVLASTSSLVLAAADRVHLIDGDRLVASGTHVELLREHPDYADLVHRGEAPSAEGGS